MTNPDFKIIVLESTNINFVYLMTNEGGYERRGNGLIKTIEDMLEQDF